VWFSRYGTLVNTCQALVSGSEASEAGYFGEEMDNLLHVETKAALLNLFRGGRISREPVSGRYLYCSVDTESREHQLTVRRWQESSPGLGRSAIGEAVPDELRARIILYYSLLNEKQRRLYAGLESLKLGYGGDRKVAEFLGIDAHTVARGREQLLAGDFEPERIRKRGAGRKRVEKNARCDWAYREVDGIRDRGRSHVRVEMVSENASQCGPGASLVWRSGEREHRGSVAARHELLLARQPQDDRRDLRTGPEPTDAPYRQNSKALHPSRKPDYQRRHEEEGTRRAVQQCRRGLEQEPRFWLTITTSAPRLSEWRFYGIYDPTANRGAILAASARVRPHSEVIPHSA